MVICYKKLLMKEWNHSSFLWASYQKMEQCTTELFIYIHAKVKPSIKNKCYVSVKVIRESEDITAAACAFPVNFLEKCDYVDAIPFVLTDFDRNKIKTLVEPLTCGQIAIFWQ